MKKFSAVLLVLALVGGALFASFTGNASVSLGVDLDKETYGFANGTSLTGDLTFLELLVDKAGEGDIYAEIKAELSLGVDFEKVSSGFNPFAGFSAPASADLIVAQNAVLAYQESHSDGDGIFDYDELTPAEKEAYDKLVANVAELTPGSGIAGVAKITSAKIIGDGWYVGILGALGAPNFAITAIERDAVTGASLLDLRETGIKAPGVEVGFAGYSISLGIDGKYTEGKETHKVLVSARTPEYNLAEGVTAKAGAAVLLNDGNFKGAISLAGGFAKDDLDISLATDLLMDKTGVADLKFDAEVALAATYDFLTADVYFATKAMAAADQTAPPSYVDPNILSVKLGAVIEGFNITVKGLDLVNQQDLSASVSYAINDAFTVAVRGGYNIKNEEWKAGAGVEYTHDMFTASLDADLNGTDEVKGLELGATIKSETLVDGATLSLGYANENILADKKGAITAKAVIKF